MPATSRANRRRSPRTLRDRAARGHQADRRDVASACGPSLFQGFPDLTRFVLNRTETGLPPQIRLFAYYIDVRSSASRQSGITASLDLADGARPHSFAEIAFSPVGYVMSVNSPPPSPSLVDISFMADAAWGETRVLRLPLPAHQIHSVLPGDFRSEAEIEASFRRG